MTSFISSFKPLGLAVGIILILEGLFSFMARGIAPQFRSNYYQLAYGEREWHAENLIKLYDVAKTSADIVSFGDSSGLFGVQTRMVNEALQGATYLNMNLSADLGFDGYGYGMKYYRQKHPESKLFFLSLTPHSTPLDFGHGLNTQSLYDNFLSVWQYLTPPVQSWRIPVTNWLYYGRYDWKLYWPRSTDSVALDSASSFEQLRTMLIDNLGWMAYPPPGPIGEVICDFREKGKVDQQVFEKLDGLAAIARSLGVEFALIYNPVGCRDYGIHSDWEQAQVDAFALKHPEVYIPADTITSFPVTDFGDTWHLTKIASVKNSERITGLLNAYLKGAGANYYRDSFQNMRDGVLQGTVRSYAEDGSVKSERNYQNGKLHGITRSYYPQGALMSDRTYELGQLTGEARLYYPNGAVQEKRLFKDGVENGEAFQYFPNGNVAVKNYYLDGLLEGRQISYAPDGSVHGEADYRRGMKHGQVIVHDPQSRSSGEYTYKRDELVGAVLKQFYPGGALQRLTKLSAGQDVIVEIYAENGTLLHREAHSPAPEPAGIAA